MKKNVMMRIASFLLVAVLITTCGISGTYAKYVTADNGSDSARVARWGVTIDATVDMFADAYLDEEVAWVASDSDQTITVRANTEGQNLVAPGTNGTMANFDISGVPEVDVKVTYTGNLTLTGWFLDANLNGVQDAGETDYCPLVITIDTKGTKEDFYIGMVGIDTVDQLETAVNNKITNYYNIYETLTNLEEVEDDMIISWAWGYETDDHPALGYQNDDRDTLLGNMVAFTTNAPIIDVAVSCTITQID